MTSRSILTALVGNVAIAVLFSVGFPLTAYATAPIPSSQKDISSSLERPLFAQSPSSPDAESGTLSTTAISRTLAQTPAVVDTSAPTFDEETVLETAQIRYGEQQAEAAQRAQDRLTDRTLAYDPALIASIGNQLGSGHSICCPAYACAYGDAVLTGTANDHENYGCGCCTWPGWGGGGSSFRSLGSDAALLHEAYDEIAAGRPTVIHVQGPYGGHWICLIGYRSASDPGNLTLDNFIALDPANGQEVIASYRYTPYGDGCEHISDLR